MEVVPVTTWQNARLAVSQSSPTSDRLMTPKIWFRSLGCQFATQVASLGYEKITDAMKAAYEHNVTIDFPLLTESLSKRRALTELTLSQCLGTTGLRLLLGL